MYMPDNETRSGVLIDNGSFEIKAGFTGDSAPRSVFRTTVGFVRHKGLAVAVGGRDALVGKKAEERRGMLDMKYPVQAGVITDWESMERVWHHTFYESLLVPPEEHPVLMTDSPTNTKANREKMLTTLFETFNTPAVFIGIQSVLSLYASGKTTGCAVDLGHGKSHVVPIFEGYALPHSISQISFAGKDITDYLKSLLANRGFAFTTVAEHELVRKIKEQHAYVSHEYKAELASLEKDPRPFEKKCALPDGSPLYLGKERFQCAEALFQPKLIGKENSANVPSSIVSVLKNCEASVRGVMSANIVLSGGTALLPGIEARIVNEMRAIAPALAPKQDIIAPPERKYTAWMGASVLSSLSTFSGMWVKKADYEESGVSSVHRKCF